MKLSDWSAIFLVVGGTLALALDSWKLTATFMVFSGALTLAQSWSERRSNA